MIRTIPLRQLVPGDQVEPGNGGWWTVLDIRHRGDTVDLLIHVPGTQAHRWLRRLDPDRRHRVR